MTSELNRRTPHSLPFQVWLRFAYARTHALALSELNERLLGRCAEEHDSSHDEPLSAKLLKFVSIVARDQVSSFTEAFDRLKSGSNRKKKLMYIPYVITNHVHCAHSTYN
jgi:hypothetical protein